MEEKPLKRGATSQHLRVAKDSRIPKILAITLKKHSFTPTLKRNTLHGLSITNPNFSEFAKQKL
jgi:hypothetical protein